MNTACSAIQKKTSMTRSLPAQVRIKTKVRAGAIDPNHNYGRIKTKVRAGDLVPPPGALNPNHNCGRIKTKVRAGGTTNHNQDRIKKA